MKIELIFITKNESKFRNKIINLKSVNSTNEFVKLIDKYNESDSFTLQVIFNQEARTLIILGNLYREKTC